MRRLLWALLLAAWLPGRALAFEPWELWKGDQAFQKRILAFNTFL